MRRHRTARPPEQEPIADTDELDCYYLAHATDPDTNQASALIFDAERFPDTRSPPSSLPNADVNGLHSNSFLPN
jgi:hypothetical protein